MGDPGVSAGMLAWAESHRVEASHSIDFFAEVPAPSQGLGAVALENLDIGHHVLTVPLESCLTPMSSDSTPDFVDEQQRLMLRLLFEDRALCSSSKFKAYLDSLPRRFPTVPLWYTSEEVKLLKGTSVDALLTGKHMANQQDLEAIQEWCNSEKSPFAEKKVSISMEDLRWAASVVASRAFDSSAVGVTLVPFADALNHTSVEPHTRMDDRGQNLVFYLEKAVMKGQEVFNCYGHHGNMQWLLNGGFVEEDNPFEEVIVTSSEVISVTIQHLRSRASSEDANSASDCQFSKPRPVTLTGAVSETVDRKENEDEKENDGDNHNNDAEDDDNDEVCLGHDLGARLTFLAEQNLVGSTAFAINRRDLLPDGLATIVLVLAMPPEDFLCMRQEGKSLIHLGEEEVSLGLLETLYTILLQLVTMLEEGYDTSLKGDLQQLAELKRHQGDQNQKQPPPDILSPAAKRRRQTCQDMHLEAEEKPAFRIPQGVRAANLENILKLRIGQKRVLAELRQQCASCFSSDDDLEESNG